jgi:hypothetical protein
MCGNTYSAGMLDWQLRNDRDQFIGINEKNLQELVTLLNAKFDRYQRALGRKGFDQ